MFYEDFFSALKRKNVRYLVAGGVAVALHGVVRMTADLDLVVSLDPENVRRFVSLMKELGYLPKAPVPPEDFADPKKRKEWKKNKNMTVFAWHSPKEPRHLIDVFIEEPLSFANAYAKKTVVKSGSAEIDVMSVEDLIVLKERAGREQDLADVRALRLFKK